MTDTVLRVGRNEKYKTVHLKACEDDSRLSWKAVGLLWYLLSRPDGWKFFRRDLVGRHTDGRDSVARGLAELRCASYVRVRQEQAGGSVKFAPGEWFVSEVPLTEHQWEVFMRRASQNGSIPVDGFSVDGGPVDGEPATNSKNSNRPKKENSASDEAPSEGDLFGYTPLQAGRVDYSAPFEELWALHARGAKKDAFEEYRKTMHRKAATHEQMVAALTEYVETLGGDFQGAHLEKWLRKELWNNVTHGNGDGRDPANPNGIPWGDGGFLVRG